MKSRDPQRQFRRARIDPETRGHREHGPVGRHIGHLTADGLCRRTGYQHMKPCAPTARHRLSTSDCAAIISTSIRRSSRLATVSFMQMILHDVTQRHEMLDSLLKAERLAAAGTFASGVAHEVNNPLASISSLVQSLLAPTKPTSSAAQTLHTILSQITRISRTLKDLRQLRAARAGRAQADQSQRDRSTETLRLVAYNKRFAGIRYGAACWRPTWSRSSPTATASSRCCSISCSMRPTRIQQRRRRRSSRDRRNINGAAGRRRGRVRDAHYRQRRRHPARESRARVRPLLHHQAGRCRRRARVCPYASASFSTITARSASKARSAKGTTVTICLPA